MPSATAARDFWLIDGQLNLTLIRTPVTISLVNRWSDVR